MFISIIDGITCSIANASLAAALAAAEETAPIAPGWLIKWNERDIIWYGYSSAKMD